MIKILHIVPNLNGGGVESLLLNYYSRMDKNKIKFDFIVHGDQIGSMEKVFADMGCSIYHIPSKSETFIGNLKAMKNIMHNNNYDIVHAHQGLLAIFPMYYAKKNNIGVRITHSHMVYRNINFIKKLSNSLLRCILKKLSTHWFACGIEAGIFLWGKKSFDKNKIQILKNAVDISKFDYNINIRNSIRKTLNIKNNKLVIGHVGRFSLQKNHNFLIDVFKEIHKINHDSILLLIGKGELEDQIKQKVKDLKLDDYVIFLGLRNNVHELLQAMDVFILPSFYEGLPVVLVESQASGLLTFASDTITKEIKVTDYLNYIDLSLPAKKWAEIILSQIPYERKSTFSLMNINGYNIENEYKKLEDFYLKEIGRKEK